MKILVTGGAGYIGSHTVVALVRCGFTPIILDNMSNSRLSVIESLNKLTQTKIIFYQGEYQDSDLLDKIFINEGVEGVIHFAAFKSVAESVIKPLKYYQNNVCGLVELLKSMEKNSIANLVFSSSCTVYGEPDNLPVLESSGIKDASTPYGTTKQMGEKIISDTTKVSQIIKSISLRYFNPIGADESAMIGELPIGEPSILVPYITQTAAGWREYLTIFGNDYATPDGTCIRDFIHVSDLANAHIKALEVLLKQKYSYLNTFNIGTGRGTSVLQMINRFESLTDRKVKYKFGERRKGDLKETFASVEKANKELGWSANKTLDDALIDAWRWQQSLKK